MIDWFDLLAVQSSLKSSPAQFKSIIALALSLLYGPTLTSVHDYWKNHRFYYTDLFFFFSKVMYMIFSMLSRFAIAFLSRSKLLTNGLMDPQVVQMLARYTPVHVSSRW